MGIVADGRLLRGAHGAAGELGQLPVGDQVVAPLGALGPLEASRPAPASPPARATASARECSTPRRGDAPPRC